MSNIKVIAALSIFMGLTGPAGAQFYGGAASTPESAAATAYAAMIQAEGMYNQLTSTAMVNVESARGMYIENQRKWTELHLIRQRLLAAEHARTIEAARQRNARYIAYLADHPSLPPRLYSGQLDSSTGRIEWPAALQRDAFVARRSEIESLLAMRARSRSTSEVSQALYRNTKELHGELRDRIRDIVPHEYMAARRFIDSLSLEGQYPVEGQVPIQSASTR